MKIIKTQAKNIFTKTKIPGADFVINQYVGCQHNCAYCYAKFIGRWKSYGRWGSWVEVKENAPDLVKDKYIKGWVYMSSVSDPYQPIERELELTKRILESLDKRIKLSIQTKSNLVLRDINLFKEFKEIEVGLTINDFGRKIKKLFEPNSPSHRQRLKTLRTLKENGIRTYGFVSPIIPQLVDIKKVIKESKESVDYFWFEVLNLKASGREFINVLRAKFPTSYAVMVNQERFSGFLENLRRTIKKEDIKTAGLEIHLPKWKTIKI